MLYAGLGISLGVLVASLIGGIYLLAIVGEFSAVPILLILLSMLTARQCVRFIKLNREYPDE
jgi:predicted PurR-regulated permease PerM